MSDFHFNSVFFAGFFLVLQGFTGMFEHVFCCGATAKYNSHRVVPFVSHLNDSRCLHSSFLSVFIQRMKANGTRFFRNSDSSAQFVVLPGGTCLVTASSPAHAVTPPKKLLAENSLFVLGFLTSEQLILTIITVSVLVVLLWMLSAEHKNRKRTEKRADQLQQGWDQILQTGFFGYHTLNPTGMIVSVNRFFTEHLEYRAEELTGKVFETLISADTRERYTKMLKMPGTPADISLLSRNGALFPVRIYLLPSGSKQGNGEKAFLSLDQSYVKQAEETSRTLSQDFESFTYSVSHDLRAPLRSIDGYSRILQEDFSHQVDEEGKKVIQVITSNAKRMGVLIDDLLDYARLGRSEPAHVSLNMTSLANGVVNELVQNEGGRKVDIQVEPLLPATGDVDMIRQVWRSLISNALKFTGKKPEARIRIRSYTEKGEAVYTIEDNGVGFDMQYAPKLFGVFQRLHKVQEFPGSGVGLAISKRIINRHKGRVWAEGKANEGATFFFTIPLNNGKQ